MNTFLKRSLQAACPVALMGLILFWSAAAAAQNNDDYDEERAHKSSCEVKSYRDTDHRWLFNFTPYLWTPGLYGDVQAGSGQAEISTDIAAGLSAEVGWCRYSLMIDAFYLGNETDQVQPDEGSNGLFEQQKFASTIALHYKAKPLEFFSIGPLAGVRYVYLENQLDRTEGDVIQSSSAQQGWLDPILGARARITTSFGLYIPLYADVGGAGFGSELTWQLYGGLGISVDHIGIELGYRHLYIDYADDDLSYQIHTSGPQLGVTFQF